MKDNDSLGNNEVINNIKIDDFLTCEKENKFTNKKISLKKRLYRLRIKTGNFEKQGLIPTTFHNNLINYDEVLNDNFFSNMQLFSKSNNRDNNHKSNYMNLNNYTSSCENRPNIKRIVRLQKIIDDKLSKLKQLINESNYNKTIK